MKKILVSLLLLALLLSLCACADPVIGETPAEAPVNAAPESVPEAVISLNGDGASYPGQGVAIEGSVIRIGAPGDYTVRGTLSNGRIIVDLKENPGKVSLYLDGVDITCLTDSAIDLVQAKELDLILVEGRENRVVSGTEADVASFSETRQGAAIYAEDDLDIQGTGTLHVFGYLNNGIACKDDLKIKGGTISVFAANNGVRASESVTITDGTLTVEAGHDGVKATSAKKADKGFVQIEGGAVSIRCTGDGVSAETELRILGGSITVTAEGDPAAASCKGLKGNTGVTISGGSIDVTADDHALKSGAAMTISGGTLQLRSRQGKGVTAETELTVSGGTLSVQSSDDGVVSADTVRVTGGELTVISGADGIQGGKKGTGFEAELGTVSIEGGRVLISAYNKAVDAKAHFLLTGGTVFACGGTSEPEAGIAWVRFPAAGRIGDELRVSADESLSLTAAYAYSSVFYADAALSEGQSCTLNYGSAEAEAEASR